MIVTTPIEAICVLHLPEKLVLHSERLEVLKSLNPHVGLEVISPNTLEIKDLREMGKTLLQVPELDEELFLAMRELNPEINFEYDGNTEVEIQMGVFRLIAKLTVKIITSFSNWASSNDIGEVYGENGEYEIEKSGKKVRRIPDVSFISFETANLGTQNSWTGFIPIPPNMALEIVSAKNGLKSDLKKMEEVWMPLGVDVGVVVCSFSEKIYIFEKGSSGYKTQSIFDDFSHPQLAGYSDNYGKYLK